MQLTPTAVARRHRTWFRLAAWAFTALAVIPTGLRPSKVLGAAKQATAKNHDDEDDDEEEDAEALARPRRSGVAVRASTAVSAYSDSDSVHVVSPTISGTVADDIAGWSVNGRYLVDAVSAASVDVVSAASGHWFEIRHVGSLAADVKTGPVGLMVGGGLSREPDYLSLGLGGTISMELMDKNFTPFIGGSYGHDDVGRTGMDKAFWQSMQKVGLQLGATFVVNRSTIASISGDLILERGYLAKPYRYVPLFAPGVGASVPPGASVDLVNQLRIDQRPADALPDARDRFAVSGRIAHRFDSSTVRFDQRLYRDSWGLTASTSDARYTVDAGGRWSLGPHVRFHAQHGIDFWQRAYEATLVAGGTLAIPRYRTGDRELGPLKTVTAGAGARYLLNTDIHSPWALTVQLEGIYTQFEDALYLKSRRALFANLSLDVGFE
ncbi:MAG TPA: DUF3570 domain-containing protein [Polyangia bacterium]|nr:DUF3570 domain-containing protein [Polyangia bacterium]